METQRKSTTHDNVVKHVGLAFGLALLLYLGGYHLIEHYRNVKGPWRVTFGTDGHGQPKISISHERLSISNVALVFQGQRTEPSINTETTVVFDTPKTNVPFGKVVFLDTTFLPGTVTFDLFGHEIELLPRTLVVDLKEVAWKSGDTIRLSHTGESGRD
ncbi:MAG: hypothetical protein HY735_32740 [Verrucomicrobia bacterium]|nr:hypothetical protein [Verrucomicrobiota bacterium]